MSDSLDLTGADHGMLSRVRVINTGKEPIALDYRLTLAGWALKFRWFADLDQPENHLRCQRRRRPRTTKVRNLRRRYAPRMLGEVLSSTVELAHRLHVDAV